MLVLITFAFATAMYILISFKAPKLSMYKNRNAHVDKSRLPIFAFFLAGVASFSALLGYITTQSNQQALRYVGLNLFIGVIMGGYLILYRNKKTGA